jgi:hypothetical protein
LPCASTPSWRVALSYSLICLSLARIRLRAGVLSSTKPLPLRRVAQKCVNPRKSNVSGLPRPRARRAAIALLPNSMSPSFRDGGQAQTRPSAPRGLQGTFPRRAGARSRQSYRPHSARQSCRPSIGVVAIDAPRDRRRNAGDVRKQRRNHSALRRPLHRFDPSALFKHPRRQPFADQPDNPPIADPMLKEPDQPLVADRVEERSDISVKDPIDPPLPSPYPSASSALCCPRSGRNP